MVKRAIPKTGIAASGIQRLSLHLLPLWADIIGDRGFSIVGERFLSVLPPRVVRVRTCMRLSRILPPPAADDGPEKLLVLRHLLTACLFRTPGEKVPRGIFYGADF